MELVYSHGDTSPEWGFVQQQGSWRVLATAVLAGLLNTVLTDSGFPFQQPLHTANLSPYLPLLSKPLMIYT